MEITDLDQTIAMTVMKSRLSPFRFLFDLENRFPINYDEMLSRVEKYANAEEAMACRRELLAN